MNGQIITELTSTRDVINKEIIDIVGTNDDWNQLSIEQKELIKPKIESLVTVIRAIEIYK